MAFIDLLCVIALLGISVSPLCLVNGIFAPKGLIVAVCAMVGLSIASGIAIVVSGTPSEQVGTALAGIHLILYLYASHEAYKTHPKDLL